MSQTKLHKDPTIIALIEEQVQLEKTYSQKLIASEISLRQQCKSQWLKDKHLNTRFFLYYPES